MIIYKNLDIFYKNIETEKIFFFYGEEDFFIYNAVQYFKEIYKNDELIIYDCANIDFNELWAQIYQNTFLNNKKRIIVKDLQDYKLSTKDEKIIESIISACPYDTSLLFIFNGKILKSGKIIKLFQNNFIFESNKLSEGETKEFIYELSKNFEIKNIEKDAVNLLYDYTGNDLWKIYSIFSQFDNKKIFDVSFISNNITYSREFNLFEFLTAVAYKKKDIVVRIVNNMFLESKFDLIQIIAALYNLFSKMLICKDVQTYTPLSNYYKNSARMYSQRDILNIMKALQFCDENIKGINLVTLNPKYLLFYIITYCF